MSWRDARRHFYWAVRARVARSRALSALAEASPDSSYDYRSRLLDTLGSIQPDTSYREMAETLEQMDLSQTLSQLRADHLARSFVELAKENRKATLDGLTRLADMFTDEERSSLITALQNASRSPGELLSLSRIVQPNNVR
jgi:acetyl-CoA carboxylase/biotin carboxylase 1